MEFKIKSFQDWVNENLDLICSCCKRKIKKKKFDVTNCFICTKKDYSGKLDVRYSVQMAKSKLAAKKWLGEDVTFKDENPELNILRYDPNNVVKLY